MQRILLTVLMLGILVHSGHTATLSNSRDWFGDAMAPFVATGCRPTVPVSSLTFGVFACRAYMVDGTAWYGVDQAAAAVGPLNAGNGTYWLAVHRSTATAVGGWTREAQTHYLWQLNATKPTEPTGGRIFLRVTVAGGVITAVSDLRPLSPLQFFPGDVRLYGAIPNDSIDDTAAFQAAFDALSAETLGTGSAANALNNMGLHEVYVPPGVWDLDSQVNAQNVSLRCAGRNVSILQGDGNTLIFYDETAHIYVRDCGFKTDVDNTITTHLHIRDSVYVEVINVSFFAASAGFTANKTIGLLFDTTAGGASVPPRGSGVRFTNILYTATPGINVTGYDCISILGDAANVIDGVVIDGAFNLEEAEVGIKITNAARTTVMGSGIIGAGEYDIQMINADSSLIIGPRLVGGASGHYNIDADSFDNVIISNSFFSTGDFGTDNGIRTTVIDAGGTAVRSFQAHTTFTGSDSAASQRGGVEVVKDATYDSHGLFVRTDTDATGDKALIKVERGTDATRDIISVDLIGTEVFEIDVNGAITTTLGMTLSNEGTLMEAAGAQEPVPGANAVRFYINEGSNYVGAGANDCMLLARLSSGTEIQVATLVTDGGCP